MSKQSCIRDVADLNQINRCIDSIHAVESSILKLSDILKLAGNSVLVEHGGRFMPVRFERYFRYDRTGGITTPAKIERRRTFRFKKRGKAHFLFPSEAL